jgi:hypothetical protein
MRIISREIRSKFEEFSIPQLKPQNISAIIPTVSATPFARYGIHAYYFLNFKTSQGLCVKVRHKDIIVPGLKGFQRANYRQYRILPLARLLFQKYHYGLNFLEHIYTRTIPHTVTELGNGRFIIGLSAYYGYLLVDCRKRSVVYRMMDKNDEEHVFGAVQWLDAGSRSFYCMTYSLKDSFKKTLDPHEKVFSRILKYDNETGETQEVWSGYFTDYIHDILINADKRYLVAGEFGRFFDKNNTIIPTKTLILDMQNRKEWVLTSIPNGAHAQFDPDDPEIVYFSNHNFAFERNRFLGRFTKGPYGVKFLGPASVHKYRLTPQGPEKIGVFSSPDLFRMTNFHVFQCAGRKVIAASGAPNFIFIADAQNLQLIKKIEISDPGGPSYTGTFSYSPDGQKLYVQNTRSFQVVDLETGRPDYIRSLRFDHSCGNHMLVSGDTDR